MTLSKFLSHMRGKGFRIEQDNQGLITLESCSTGAIYPLGYMGTKELEQSLEYAVTTLRQESGQK